MRIIVYGREETSQPVKGLERRGSWSIIDAYALSCILLCADACIPFGALQHGLRQRQLQRLLHRRHDHFVVAVGELQLEVQKGLRPLLVVPADGALALLRWRSGGGKVRDSLIQQLR